MRRCPGSSVFLLPLVAALCLLASCAPRAAPTPGTVADLEHFPQDLAAYASSAPDAPLYSPATREALYRDFLARHFGPWHRAAPLFKADAVFWGFDAFRGKTLYGENLLPRPPAWLESMRRLSRMEDFPNDGRPAITVNHSSLRVLPSRAPAFYNPARTGSGFPFDQLQNSLVWAGTPIYVSHVSADGAWVLAECRFAFGWLAVEDVAFTDQEFMRAYETGTYAAMTSEHSPLYDVGGGYRTMGRIGMVLPVTATDEGGFQALFPARDENGNARAVALRLPLASAEPMPLEPSAATLARLGNRMMGQPYGWGGLFENRDCSALLLDLFAPLGVYLPRNSKQQAEYGRVVDLKGLDSDEKKKRILAQGAPFLTLLRKPGHIMLYLGPWQGEPAALHSVWGLGTVDGSGRTGRHVLGKVLVTGLEPGLEIPEVKRGGSLLDTITALSLLPPAGR